MVCEPAIQDSTEENRRKIMNVVNQLDDLELARVSDLLAKPQNEDDYAEETAAETLID